MSTSTSLVRTTDLAPRDTAAISSDATSPPVAPDIMAYYATRPTSELQLRVDNNRNKILRIEKDFKNNALASRVTLTDAKRSVRALGQQERNDIQKLMESLHPDTKKFLEDLAATSLSASKKLRAPSAPSSIPDASASSAQKRIKSTMSHLLGTSELSSSSTTATMAATGGATNNAQSAKSNQNIIQAIGSYLTYFLTSIENRLKIWEDSELRRGKDAIEQAMKTQAFADGITDDTKRYVVRKRFVLSIDGGGIKGKIPALVMDHIEKRVAGTSQVKVFSHQLFDLITGTSTGAILACGASILGRDRATPYSADELVKIYDAHGSHIFSRSIGRYIEGTLKGSAVGSFAVRFLSRWYNRPYALHTGAVLGALGGLVYHYNDFDHYMDEKYTRNGLEEVVTKYFGDRTLSHRVKHINKGEQDRCIQLFIPTCLAATRKPQIFDSAKCDQKEADGTQFSTVGYHDLSVRDILLSTTAAPTYFPQYQFKCKFTSGNDSTSQANATYKEYPVVDGGVCFNNPALLGYARARTLWPGDRVHLLSLGTGYNPEGPLGAAGKARMAEGIVSALFQAQSYATSKFLDTLAGRVVAPLSIMNSVEALAKHSFTALESPSLISGDLMVPTPYRPLDCYRRVDGALKQRIDLDAAYLLNPGNDVFTEAANKFIQLANPDDAKEEDVTLDKFMEMMRTYHGF